jgi:hypothetical protein
LDGNVAKLFFSFLFFPLFLTQHTMREGSRIVLRPFDTNEERVALEEEILHELGPVDTEEPSTLPPFPHMRSYKFSEASEMNKDNAAEDFDSLEVFCRLKNAKILYLDEPAVREHITFSSDEELLAKTAYISEGQVKRLKLGEEKLFSFDSISDIVDETQRRVGLRQRGGGRAASLFSSFSVKGGKELGYCAEDFVDVKGIGTSILQSNFPPNATGFLCLADALREVLYERLLRRNGFSTVKYLGILDCGFEYRDENPATGYAKDRVCLLLREAHSRLCSPLEVVHYSVAQIEDLKNLNFLKQLREVGVSSEQVSNANVQHLYRI